MLKRAGRCIAVVGLALAAACAAPPTPSPIPETATPNGVQTALAQLTASFASLTPTGGADTSATPLPTQTLRVSETLRVLTLTPSPSQTPVVSTATAQISTVAPTPRITGTASVSATATITPATALPIVPGNAISLTQAAVLAQTVLSGTPPARLDQVAWAPDGQLAAAGAAGALFAQGETLSATRGYTMGVWVPSLSFSPDNRALALSSVGETVRLFNRDTGALLFQLVQPNLRVVQVRYRPGPPGVLTQYLASLGGDNTVYLWDVAYRRFLGTLNPGFSGAEALEISGDGRWLAAASGNAVVVWDMSALPAGGWTGAFAPTLTLTQAGAVTGLALSQDGVLLAASNAAGTIELWTLPDGQPLGAFGRLNALPARLVFSPDGQLVAAAYSDQVIRLWALSAASGTQTGRAAAPLAELAGHTARITSLAFSPDGSVLASSSWDGSVRLWAAR